MADIYTKYDPNVIIAASEEKRKKGDMGGAEMMFQSALLEWVDDAREGGVDPEFLREAIATLWLAYADFFRTNKAVSYCYCCYYIPLIYYSIYYTILMCSRLYMCCIYDSGNQQSKPLNKP